MRCGGCGFASPTPDFLITDIDRENGTFTVSHHGQKEVYNLINDNIVNLYNFCGLVALLTTIGLSYDIEW